MLRATELAHLILRQSLKPGDVVVDATVGNGHDTLFLAERVGPQGRVFGFDIQETALAEAARRLEAHPQATLIHAGHEKLTEHLPTDEQDQLAAVMFNLGYLPGGNKDIITHTETTLIALKQALTHLRVHGLVTLVLYSGHPGGEQEATALHAYIQNLPETYTVSHYARLNTKRPAPELLVIEHHS